MVKKGQNTMSKPTRSTVTPISFDPPESYLLDAEVMPMAQFRHRLKDTQHLVQRPLFYMMFMVEKGELIHSVDCVTHHCKAGDGLLIKPNQIHQFSNQLDWEGWVLIFSPNLLFRNSREEEILYQLPTTFSMSDRLFKASTKQLQSMSEDASLESDKNQINTLLRHQLSSLIVRLRLEDELFGFHLDTDPTNAARFKRFRLLLEQYFNQAHQVGFYAKQLGLSNKTLNRLCLQIVNTSAKTLITERILLEAKRLLVHTMQPIGSIADALAFNEVSNFVKLFKKHAHSTPRQFRIQNRASM